MRSTTLLAAPLAIATVACVPTFPAAARPPYVTAFQTAYPASSLLTRMATQAGRNCYVCHQPTSTSNAGNCYRTALAARIAAGRTIAQALADVDQLDSDNDGVSNHDEILWPRADLAGQIGFNPGLIGSTGTDPCAVASATPVSNASETPCRADCNRNGATDVQDIFDFLALWFVADPMANFNGGDEDIQDIFDFLAAWFTGC